ncbi:MAG: hypothetical protein IJ722_06910 [Alloprevotella sp.]|nr:hypothetical protein [Alloprevotella sp.]
MERKTLLSSVLLAACSFGVLAATAQDQVIRMTTDKAVGEELVIQVNRMTTAVTVDWGDGTAVEYTAGDGALTTIQGKLKGSEVVLTGGSYLNTLVCEDAGLTSLVVTGAPKLQSLYCHGNKLTAINLNGLSVLRDLDLSGNQLTALSISESAQPLLENINVAFNDLQKIGSNSAFVFRSSNVQHINIAGNKFSRVYTTSNPNLDALICSGNALTSLDLSKNPQVSTVVCHDNQIARVSLPTSGGLPALQQFICDNNEITSLDFSSSSLLTDLSCANNGLSDLSIPNRKLSSFNCGGNALTFRSLPSEANRPAEGFFSYLPQADLDVVNLLTPSAKYGGHYLPVCPDWASRTADEYVLDLSSHRFNGGNRATVVFNCYAIESGGVETPLVQATSKDREQDYALTSGRFAFLKPFERVVIQLTEPSYPGLVIRTTPFVVGEDNISGITSVGVSGEKAGAVYDMQGRRVAHPANGIFIQNGKKVIIK